MKRKYVYLYLLGLLLFSVACTGNFRDYNTDSVSYTHLSADIQPLVACPS